MVLIVNLKNSGTDIDLLYINISYCMDHFVNSTVFCLFFFFSTSSHCVLNCCLLFFLSSNPLFKTSITLK